MAEDVNCVMVASIDFGTTFSGYTCSLKGQEIKINKNWGDSQGHQVIYLSIFQVNIFWSISVGLKLNY